MPSFCVVLDCEQKYIHIDNVSFHKFPKDEELLSQWKLFTGRCESWQPSRWSAICSRHFKDTDFRKSATRKILKRNAIPSILQKQNENSTSDTKASNGENSNVDKDSKETKTVIYQQHLGLSNTKLIQISTKQNNASEMFSIPIEVPQCMESENLLTTSTIGNTTSQQYISHNESQQYDINMNGNLSLMNFYDQSSAPCRLCGQEDHITNSFLNDFEIFGMIQKCMPTLNIRQDDIYSKEVCSNCLEQLENFNVFVDQVISHQKSLIENIQPHQPVLVGKHPTVISSVKIKQEPVSNVKVNIKQEILDTHYPQQSEENPDNTQQQINLQYQDDVFPIETETEDQKFHFRDSNSLNTREIVKNCDIIEIINLEDGYIDIIDDEIDDSQDTEQLINNKNHPKVIDNKEIKIQKHYFEDFESISKDCLVNSSQVQYVIEEHNYTKNCGIDQNFKMNGYKQEIPEDKLINSEQIFSKNETNVNNNDHNKLNMNKIDLTNSPKKNSPKKEKTFVLKAVDNQLINNMDYNEAKLSFDYITQSIEYKMDETSVVYNSKDRIIFSEEDSKKVNPIRSKNSNKSNIVVINESILKPGIQPFEFQKCLECGLQFFSVESLNEHLILHHSKPSNNEIKTAEVICTHFCVLCESNFDSFFELLKHRGICHVKTKSIHKTKKIKKNMWKCLMCLKAFSSKLALNNHRKYICKFPQNGNCFNCKYCGDVFKKWILCRRHEKLCRTYKIRRKTEKETLNKNSKEENFEINKLEMCKKEPNIVVNSIEENSLTVNRYNCETCNRSYTRYQNLLRHKKVHRPKEEWNYKCGSCNKRFDRMYDLKVHLKSAECPCVPSKPDTILFVCQICGKKFKTLQTLKEHGITHSDELPYICNICNKSFKALRNLRQHKITHTNVKTVQCNLCNKTFKRLNGLLQHKKGFHLKIKPHICEICKHAYSLKGDMLRCKHKFLSV